MKQFKKECKHAQEAREEKYYYEETELAEGCWICGKPLTLVAHSREEINEWGNEDFQRIALDELAAWKIRSLYECVPCAKAREKKMLEEDDKVYATLDELWEDQDAETEAFIKDVEKCGPDCVFWDRMIEMKKEQDEN